MVHLRHRTARATLACLVRGRGGSPPRSGKRGLAEWPDCEDEVEELPENRVRLQVEVPSDHVKHAVEHASSDLAATAKIPGFRKGKVPQKVLEARVGRDRIFTRGGREPHQRLVLERSRGREHQARVAAAARLRRADLRGRALQLHRRGRSAAAARGGRLGRPRGAGARARGAPGAHRRRDRGAARVGRRARPSRGPPVAGRRRARRRPRRRVGRGAARLRRPARRRAPARGHRARPARDEHGRDEEDRVHRSRREPEGGGGDAEGDQGAGPAAARRRARPVDERVRDARGAPHRDRVAPPRGDPGRARGGLPRRRRRQADRGVEGGRLRLARRCSRRRVAERDAALPPEPRPRRRDLPPCHRPDPPKTFAKPFGAKRGARSPASSCSRRSRTSSRSK